MLQNQVHTSNKKKRIIVSVIILIAIVAAINIFVLQSTKKGEVKTGTVSFEKVSERKLNNTKLISGQVKPGNIEGFYTDSTKGKVKDITVKEGQE
ncbi:efflux transporter periplasmic adaptor subunit, partial [Bacillus paranthracis]|nr:efflux transporter periplasmic adaptor subunit [Bacillus paranthracis]